MSASMTRQHFAAVAEVLADQRRWHLDNDSPAMAEAVASVAHELAREFKQFNANFSRDRFLRACGCAE